MRSHDACGHDIPALSGRTSALQQLVLQAPAPVVATMLGYTHDHTARTATTAGSTWSRYAPGDHTQLNPRGHQVLVLPCGSLMVEQHLQHVAVEFRNWILAAGRPHS